MSSTPRWLVLPAAVVVILTSCVDHPVGPTRSFESYTAKASSTAESALSAVETVRLLAQTAGRGDSFGAFASIAVSEQESALSRVRGTFESIQPPDDRAVELRGQLVELLNRANGHVADVRIEVRRGNLAALGEVAEPLAIDAEALRAEIEELS
jgi:hypothetical protein